LTPPFTDVHTLAAAGGTVPIEHDFNITDTGPYQIVLTDLGAQYNPAVPLSQVTMAVTTGNILVAKAQVGVGVYQFNAAAKGTYTVHVVGTPGTSGAGVIGLQVGTAANPTSLGNYSDNIAPPSGAPPSGTAILDDSFTVPTSGTYSVTLGDMKLPQMLTTLTLAITETAGSIVQILPNAGTATVSLSSGITYRINAVAVAAASSGGLFNATVIPQGGGTQVYGKAIAVGTTTQVGTPTLSAGDHSIKLTDLSFPVPLTQLGAAVMFNGQSVTNVPLAAAGTQTFTAAAGTYQVFAVATPQAAAPPAGAYSLQILPTGGAAELSLARIVTVTASGGNSSPYSAYSFDSTLPSAGAYAVTLTDFSFPVALNAVRLAAVQNGALVGTPLTAAGTLNLNAQAGAISYLVIAQADPAHGGLFDVNATASGSTTLIFDATQGVGTGFISRKVNVTTVGTYGITSSDIGFPASFTNLALVATQGANNLGNIFSLGNLSLKVTTPGTYFINLIAVPSAAAATYAVVMAPAPTVSLTSSATNVASGGTVTLTWSSQNATACTAKDGWTGSQTPGGGTFTTPALTANTTFTLSCTGAGGTTSTSVTVTVTSPPAQGGGGGGGSIDEIVILGLATLLARRLGTLRK